MIGVLSAERCCGCAACRAVCPRAAIRMCPDAEGFLQPTVDATRCVQCGLCRKACPVLCPGVSRQPLSVFAARAKDDGLRSASSSGGIFSLLARQTLAKGGIVYGAAVQLTDGKVVHQSAEREQFFRLLRVGRDFDGLVQKFLRRPLWRRCGSLAKRLIRKAFGK